VADLFEDYRLGTSWDEMLGAPDEARGPYRAVHHTLRAMHPEALRERADFLARSFLDQGVTFDHAGEERPFPLDAVPRVISAEEWAVVEQGVEQRVRALEAFLADVYNHSDSEPTAVRQGIIPWELITSSPHYHRAVHGIRPTNDVRAHVSGIDIIRDEAGTFRVSRTTCGFPPASAT